MNKWRITGYRGNNDYDGIMDNNLDFETYLDSRLKKDEVLNLFFGVYKKSRNVCINADLISEELKIMEKSIDKIYEMTEEKREQLMKHPKKTVMN